jgi:hypothetical protein
MASTKAPDAAFANPEPRESIWLRRLAILSFWVVVLFFGLPIWLKTTAVYRAKLPLQQMTDWAEGKACITSLLTPPLLMSPRCARQFFPSALRWKPPYHPPRRRTSYV